MLECRWRQNLWNELKEPWDLIIIGGGITGAGILRLASLSNLKVLLFEANDFASGTSSRSSKLVHGGLRYLYNRQYNVTRESVKEREWLLNESGGLVDSLSFLLPNYSRYHKSGWEFRAGVILYDLMAPKWDHRSLSRCEILEQCSHLKPEGLLGGCIYGDARVDDARLVLRVLDEATRVGGTALNYAQVTKLVQDQSGKVSGVVVKDNSGCEWDEIEIHSKVVVNATGPWSDDIRAKIGQPPRLRRQRGSHIVFPYDRLPINQAVTLFHPKDHRALFAIPWEGVTIIGTTDIDHNPDEFEVNGEPFASPDELEYLMDLASTQFPSCHLNSGDILSSFAGVRPVVKGGENNPSKESRAHAIWVENGLITITGGKLTTFRLMASQVMAYIFHQLEISRKVPGGRIFSPVIAKAEENQQLKIYRKCLGSRYGGAVNDLLEEMPAEEFNLIDQTPYLWAELRWNARYGNVVHLDDLLLRRVRLGIVARNGGTTNKDKIQEICYQELGWDEIRWRWELERYQQLWSSAYSPTPGNRQEYDNTPDEIAHSHSISLI